MEKTKKYIARKNRRGLFGFFSFRAAIINVDVDIEMILKNKSRKGLALVQIRWKLRWWLIGKCGFLWCVRPPGHIRMRERKILKQKENEKLLSYIAYFQNEFVTFLMTYKGLRGSG